MMMPVAIMMAVFVFIVLMLMRRVGQLEQEVEKLMCCLDDQGEINANAYKSIQKLNVKVMELDEKVNGNNNN